MEKFQRGHFIKLSDKVKAALKTDHNYAVVEDYEHPHVIAYFVEDNEVNTKKIIDTTQFSGTPVCLHHYDFLM
jgi:hypothetical protein